MKTHKLSIFCAALVAVTLSTSGALSPQESKEYDGQQAPDFSVKSAKDGGAITLKGNEGKPVILEFFASWCPPCRAQLGELSKIHAKYSDKGLVVVAVSVDPIETPDSVKDVAPLADKLKLPFAVALATQEMADGYHYKGIPTTVIVGRDGKIARTFFGLHNANKLDSTVKSAVEGAVK